MGVCAVLGGLIWLTNPNFRWSENCEVPYGADFLQEWVAGDMLLSGAAADIYDAERFVAWQHDSARLGFVWPEHDFYPAVYPPAYYCLVAPLAAVPYRAAVPLWLVLMLGCYAATAWCVQRAPDAEGSSPSRNWLWLFWCAALLFPALFMGLVMGQKGTLWCLLLAASWRSLRAGRPFAAGCLWGLLALKPTLAFVLPLLMLCDRQWRFIAGLLVTLIGLVGLTVALMPIEVWMDYAQVIAGSADYQASGGYRSGWSTSLWSLLGACGCPRPLAIGLWLGAAAAMLGLLVRYPEAEGTARYERPEFLFRVLLTTALLSPHFYFYDLVWLLVPIGFWLRSDARQGLAVLVALWLGMLIAQPNDQGWPLLSGLLLALWGYITVPAVRRGTSFA